MYCHTHTSEFRIDFQDLLSPFSSPAFTWVMPKCDQRKCSATPIARQQGASATAVRAKGASTALSALPPPRQTCLYISLSQSFMSAGKPPFPYQPAFQGIQERIAEPCWLEADPCIPFLYASFSTYSLFKIVSVCIIPRDN